MKILLINPPFESRYSVGASQSMRHVLNRVPPLGLAYLAAAVENKGHSVAILDCTLKRFGKSAIAGITEGKPSLVGITATTPAFDSAERIAAAVKKVLPGAVIVLGGVHVTALPLQAMENGCFDIGVLGEGEETFLELVCHIEDKGLRQLHRIKGIVFKENDCWVCTPKRAFIKELDALAYPSRHLLPPLSSYKPTPASYRKLPLGIVMSSRGCPHQCTFCDKSVFGSCYRQRNAGNVLGEVEELVNKYGAKEIRFFDDCFTLDKERTINICGGMRRMRQEVPWTCLTTVTSVTKELLREMKASGCWQVLFGLESGDADMLKRLKKGTTIQQNTNAVRWAKEAGLSVRADFIVGAPGETEKSLKKTLDFALRMKLDYAHFNKFVPFPGTELYRSLISDGHQFHFGEGCSITAHKDFLYIPKTVNRYFYEHFINYAHRKFYLRPEYILRRLSSLKSWDEFLGQVRGFFSIAMLR